MKFISIFFLLTTSLWAYRATEAVVKLRLIDQLNKKIDNYDIENIQLPNIPKKEIIKSISINRNNNFSGPVSFRINTTKNSYYASCNIIRYQEIYEIKSSVKRGDFITESMVEKKTVAQKGTINTQYITNLNEINGMVFKSNLKENTILMKYHLEKPNLIKNGDMVNIVASVKGLKVSMHGIAKQNGKENSYIMVQNITTKKYLRAKVISERQVALF